MKRLSVIVPIAAILALLVNLLGLAGTLSADENGKITVQSLPNRYIVHFKHGVSSERIQQIDRETGATVESEIPQINIQVVKIPEAAILNAKAFSQYSEIDSIEPDYVVSASETTNDTQFSQQWGINKIQAPQAWNLTHGSSTTKIAILDTGIDSSHPDLASKVVVKKNFTDSSTAEDKYGHGTHVAGIAAAITNNAAGVAGVAYNASLMNVKVLGDSGNGSYSAIVQGIIWAADNGANVINMSIGGSVSSSSMQEAIDYAWNKGAVVVVAAGNNGNSNPSYPAYYDNCIAVAATTSSDQLYSFSNYGNWVDVAAPGDAISTLTGGSYGNMAGTSMASPFVSGLAGLAFAIAKDTNGNGKVNDEVRDAIQKGSDNIGLSNIGSGRINAYRTISLLKSSATPTPATKTFGLNSGDSTWDQPANILDVMRFKNTAGTGNLTKLEILFSDTTPTGKVRLGIYADNYGKPGNLILNAGEVTITNGWAVKSGLNLPVSLNRYYWLAFEMQNGNRAVYLSDAANTSRIPHYWVSSTYGPLPTTFKMTGASSNFSPYVMRATITTQ